MTQLSVTERIAFICHGTPITQGSKTRNRYGMHDDNAKVLKPWRKKVREHAEDATRYVDPFTGPVQVWIRFTFDRPRSHYRTGRNAHLLRTGAPRFPTFKNDIDKLQRAAFDAMTDAKVWLDDGQVVDVRAHKFYADEHELALPRAGVAVIVEALPTPDTSPAEAASPARPAGEAPAGQGAVL
ncbi:RusA family crossover junction endodeoxyribonuclease [Nocardioides sp. InS609-2]|uniref:RusA family crossover junction endodeoxyribonuclease n=1 Tax=Nocardioides sp. InS609-2 TaxID=2760705 RepID=UPI0024A6D9EE|nr:RusA family crossover junction endodeoxyribonuclease [Nocardioides sp. InS609-2]